MIKEVVQEQINSVEEQRKLVATMQVHAYALDSALERLRRYMSDLSGQVSTAISANCELLEARVLVSRLVNELRSAQALLLEEDATLRKEHDGTCPSP